MVQYLPAGNLLMDATFDLWNQAPVSGQLRQADIPPGASIIIEVPAGTIDDYVGLGTNELMAVPTFLLRNLGSFVPAGDAAELKVILDDCGFALSVSGLTDLLAILNCVKSAALLGGKTTAKVAANTALFLLDGTVSLDDTLRVSSGSPWDLRLTWRALPPPVPTGQPTDGATNGAGPTTVRILKLASPSTASYVLDSDGVAHHIPNGGVYLCNAAVMPVQFNVSSATFASLTPGDVGDDAGCPPPGTPARSLQQSSTKNFLLRQADGSSWLTDAIGRKTIVIGGEGSFNCFANVYLVWDYVTEEELVRFPGDPSTAGRFCGTL